MLNVFVTKFYKTENNNMK